MATAKDFSRRGASHKFSTPFHHTTVDFCRPGQTTPLPTPS